MKRLIAAGLFLTILAATGTYFAVGSGLLPGWDTKPALTGDEAVNIVLAHLNDGLPHIVKWGNSSVPVSSFSRYDVEATTRYQDGKWMVTIYGASWALKKQAEGSRESYLKMRHLNTGIYVVDDKTGKVIGP